MIQQLCNELNKYYAQFNKGEIENSITIRPIKYNDELVNDIIIFFNEKDKNEFEQLLKELNELNVLSQQLAKEQKFEKAGELMKRKAACIDQMERLIYKGSFSSKQMFTVTKNGVIVYIHKRVIDGNLFKKFLDVR